MKTFTQLTTNFFSKGLVIMALAASSMFFTGCEKDDDSFSGEFEVEMTDGPGDYAKIDVEVKKVEVRHESEGWITLNNESQIVTVTDLTNGKSVSLGSDTELKAGVYPQARVTFGTNNSIMAELGGTMVSFSNSADQQVTVDINYTVGAESENKVLLDFRVGESVVNNLTSWALQPKLVFVSDTKTGVRGTLESNARAYVSLTGNGEAIDTYTNENGEFLIRGSVSGTYNLEIEPRSGQGFTATTVENVTIVDGEIKSMGTITLNQ